MSAVAVVLLLAAPSFGGYADFTPAIVDNVIAGTPIIVDVDLVEDGLGDFDAAFALIGSDSATNLSFSFSTDWTTEFSTTYGPTNADGGLYAQGVYVGGEGGSGVGGITMGTLTIDTTGMLDGDYTVEIDSGYDDDTSGLYSGYGEEEDFEDLYGVFDFTIVPEPSGLALMALGVVAMLRRR
ncbi:MAG: PEP-CTERM sorting domain-containing protein [bacterium]|nr:PEP-CTERM sorting domain-containing protein [bacterium]